MLFGINKHAPSLAKLHCFFVQRSDGKEAKSSLVKLQTLIEKS